MRRAGSTGLPALFIWRNMEKARLTGLSSFFNAMASFLGGFDVADQKVAEADIAKIDFALRAGHGAKMMTMVDGVEVAQGEAALDPAATPADPAATPTTPADQPAPDTPPQKTIEERVAILEEYMSQVIDILVSMFSDPTQGMDSLTAKLESAKKSMAGFASVVAKKDEVGALSTDLHEQMSKMATAAEVGALSQQAEGLTQLLSELHASRQGEKMAHSSPLTADMKLKLQAEEKAKKVFDTAGVAGAKVLS